MSGKPIRDRDWIAGHLPHQGSMCLLEWVESFDARHIRCFASSHRRADNPLRRAGRLGTAAGIEYAAQAMAIHGALMTLPRERPRVGYLASVRDVELLAERLDDAAAHLCIEAERIAGNDAAGLYRFQVLAGKRCLLHGRASVIVDPQKHITPDAGFPP